MDLATTLPRILASLNAVNIVLLAAAYRAIRRGERDRHRALMLVNLGIAVLFIVVYVTQTTLVGYKRFPGDDWVRTVFLTILTSHTILAVSLVPLVLRTVYLAFKERFTEHRKIARGTFPIWVYVSLTGVAIYWMINHLRPPV
jgi:putative membrane protein